MSVGDKTFTISFEYYCFPILFWQRLPILFDAVVTQSYDVRTIDSCSNIDFCQGDGYEDSEAHIRLDPKERSVSMSCYILQKDTPSFSSIPLRDIASVLKPTNKFDYLKKEEQASESLIGATISYRSDSRNEGVVITHNETSFSAQFSDFYYERL